MKGQMSRSPSDNAFAMRSPRSPPHAVYVAHPARAGARHDLMRPEAGSWLHGHECRRAHYSGIIRGVPPVNIARDADDFGRVRGVPGERDAPRDRIAIAEIAA